MHGASIHDSSVTDPTGNGPDFYKMTVEISRNRELSQSAKMLYGRLALFAGKNGFCNPSHDKLAFEIGVNPRQVRNALAELSRCGLVDWKRTRSSSIYEIHPPAAFKTADRQSTANLDRQSTADQSGNELPIKRGANRCLGKDVDLDCPLPRKRAAETLPPSKVKQYPQLRRLLEQYRVGGDKPISPEHKPSDSMVTEIFHAANGRGEKWIVDELAFLHNDKGLHWGTQNGPRTYQWFVTVVADKADRTEALEMARAPESKWDHDGTRMVS